MLDDTVIHAQLTVHKCVAELWVNRFPVHRLGASPSTFASAPVHQYLKQKNNTLTLVVEATGEPSSSLDRARRARLQNAAVRARLVELRPGTMANDKVGKTIISADWRSTSQVEEVFPIFIEESTDTELSHGAHWRWLTTPQLTLDTELHKQAVDTIDEFEEALGQMDAGKLWTLTQVKTQETLLAYPSWSEAEVRQDLQEFIDYYQQPAGPALPRFDSHHHFRLVADKRVIQCIGDDWEPSVRLRSPADGTIVPYELFLARIDDGLHIVR